MKATKAYILAIDTDLSREYSAIASVSCAKAGIEYEIVQGYTEKTDLAKVWKELKFKKKPTVKGKGGACTAGHIALWDKIAQGDEAAIILEHDAILLHAPDFDIPDGSIVALGYKVKDPKNYDHVRAGPPRDLVKRGKHGGAHAYALTPKTAQKLLDSIRNDGLTAMVDNAFFLRLGKNAKRTTPLLLTDPVCALGWLRESTIWKKAAVDNYRPLLPSFEEHYNSKENLGLKG